MLDPPPITNVLAMEAPPLLEDGDRLLEPEGAAHNPLRGLFERGPAGVAAARAFVHRIMPHGMRLLLAAIHEAVTRLPREDWRARTRAALAAYLETLAAMPDAAWAYTIEVMGAGRRALQARAWVTGQWTGQWRTLHARGLTSESAPRELDDAQLVALVGGIEELVRDCLQRRGAAQLPSLLEPASCFALAVLAAPGPGSSA